MSATQGTNLVPLPRHHSKVTSASSAKGLHQPPSLCAQKVCVLLFLIVFQVIVSQKYRIVNILGENNCGENFLQEVFPTPLSRTLAQKNTQIDFEVFGQTVNARINLALAIANSQAPPRPCSLRELFCIKAVDRCSLVSKGNRHTILRYVILSGENRTAIFSAQNDI